jgi:hypothetical protein
VDAVVAGDADTLTHLLNQNPELIHVRSMRTHHATLLHYVGANGVEGWRQRTPKNAVRIAEILLDAGSEVDAAADMYHGGCTTLGLVATLSSSCWIMALAQAKYCRVRTSIPACTGRRTAATSRR